MSITDEELLKKYLNQYKINNLFSKNMIEYMELMRFNKEEYIFKEGEKLNYFYFLVKGKVKIYSLLKNGKQVLLRFIQPLATLGEVELVGDYLVKNNALVKEDSVLIGIKKKIVRDKMHNDNRFLLYINKILSHKLYTIDKTMALNQSYPLETRLASYLITLNAVKEKRIKEIKTLKVGDIAELLGSSVRHLNRVINDLKRKEILERKNNIILVKDYDKLKKMAEELYD